MTEANTRDLRLFLNTANVLENMGDLIETRFVPTGQQRARMHEEFSEKTRGMTRDLTLSIIPVLEDALEAVDTQNVELAEQIRREKTTLRARVEELRVHLEERLLMSSGDRARIYGLETEIVESSKRLYDLAKRIAKAVQERGVESEGT